MTQLIPFQFDCQNVRVIQGDDGEPWFVAADIAHSLGYRDASSMTRLLDEDEKGHQIVVTPGGRQEMATVNESGIYSATFKSRSAVAKPFRKWVTSDVLPAIRKHGRYEAAAPVPAEPDNMTAISRASAIAGALDAAARAFGFDDNMRLISVNNAVQRRTGVNLLGELGATHLLSPINERFLTPTELGLPFDMSAVAVNRALRDLGYQRQERDAKGKAYWVMTERGRAAGGRMMDTGKKHGDGVAVQQLKWPESVAEVLREEAA